MFSGLRVKIHELEFSREFYLFWVVHVISDVFVMNFFQIMLYRSTGTFDAIVLSNALNSAFTFIGIAIGSVLIDRLGYLKMFRVANFLSAAGLIFVALMLSGAGSNYPFYSILIFIPRGLFWATYNTSILREGDETRRRVKINVSQSVYLIITVVVSPVVGFLLAKFNGYEAMYVLAGLIYLISVFVPFKYNRVPNSNLTVKEIQSILRNKRFPLFFSVFFVGNVFVAASGIVSTLIAYLVLGNEFNVGVVASFVSLVGGLMLFLKKRIGKAALLDVGYLSNGVIAVGNLLFFILWSPAAFVVNKLLGASLGGWSSASIGDQDYQARGFLLGKEVKQSAVEINLIVETIFLISRIFSAMSIYFLLQSSLGTLDDVLRWVFGFSGFNAIISFVLYRYFNSRNARFLEYESAPVA